MDALIDRYRRAIAIIKHSLEHEVDYDREESYADEHSKYVRMHKNYRYLIEKFVQINSSGNSSFDTEKFQYLVALVDWLHVFYQASDSLHYNIHPLGLMINQDYLVEVKYDGEVGDQEKEFMRGDASNRLGLIGRSEDQSYSSRNIDDFINALDVAFKKDLGFGFQSMMNVLQVMSDWGDLKAGIDINPWYSASLKEIVEICLKEIKGIEDEEIKLILKFLTLRSKEVVQVLGTSAGKKEICSDLPVWEYRKRFARYNLRPIIRINNKYFWGPYSTMNSGIIWSGHIGLGTLPTDLGTPAIESVVYSEKKLIEDELVDKALEIVNRFTKFIRKNLMLDKLKTSNKVPDDLGDYDVLAYIKCKNIVLNIECKDILQPFCIKDMKRLREKIFGTDSTNGGHFKHIMKRAKYLDEHLHEFTSALRWPIDYNNMPEILTIYLTRKNYWWTKFPPYEVNTTFLQVDELSDFIEHLDTY